MDNWVPYAALGLLVVIVIAMFNSLIGKKNQVDFAFASIDAQLKKRFDLIPNLVASCEKYMGHEQQVLKDLVDMRAKALRGSPDDQVALDGQLSAQLRSVMAVAEGYPALRAVETFTMLQRSLNEVEEQLAAARRAFNAAVTAYNNAVEMFPTSVMARLMGCHRKPLFEITEAERQPVKVWG